MSKSQAKPGKRNNVTRKPLPKQVQSPSPQEINALVHLFSAGRFAEAAILAQSMTTQFPLSGVGWKALGVAFCHTGRTVDSLSAFQKAAQLMPRDAETLLNLGNSYTSVGRLADAEASFGQALAIKPDYAQAHNNLGNVLEDMKRLDEAEASYRQAIRFHQSFAAAHTNLGNVQKALGRFQDAEQSFRKSLQADPTIFQTHNSLGNLLQDLRRPADAEAGYRQAITLNPNYAEAHYNLANLFKSMGRLEEARALYLKAILLSPHFVEAHNNLANTLYELGHLNEAEAVGRRTLEIAPDSADAHYNVGNTLKDQGRLAEAETYYRGALQRNANFIKAYNNLLYILNFTSDHTPVDYLTHACQFGQVVRSHVSTPFVEWTCARQPERLRVGLVSGDFKNHPVGYFLESVLARIDPRSLELIAYSTGRKTDALTERIRPNFTDWKLIADLSDEAAARLIHSDGVHILIDLSGHTQHNRLPIFSWKPAPIQVTWLGYFASTGISEIDYILGDPHVTPIGESDHFVEKIWQLPHYYTCFTELDVVLEISTLPARSSGHITFGCFNNLLKINDAVVAVWAEILHAVPGSKLFLKYAQLGSAPAREVTVQRFAAHGISAERLILEGSSSRADYLATYHRVDMALDPFPYPGGTTSIEGLWMGVPFITKRGGDRFLSHHGQSIAHNAGLSEWIAADAADYVNKAISFSSDLERLAKLRSGLRRQVLASPLFDASGLARNVEEAMWGMWKLWQG